MTIIPLSRDVLRPDVDRAALAAELFRQRDHAVDESTRLAAVEQLVALHLPLARAAANRYLTHRDDHEDVLQVAYLGLVKAVLRFTPEVGAPFGAFATPTILGEVRRYFRDHAWDIRPPRWIQELRPDIERTVERLTALRGRVPTTEEVAEEVGRAPEEVREAMLATSHCLNTYSLDMPGDTGTNPSVQDSLGDVDHDLEIASDKIALRPLIAALDDRDRQMVVLRFVRGLTQRQIAEAIGLSQTQVCRLLDRILADLRSRLEGSPTAA